MAIEINKGIEPFEDRTDFTRNNPDRKPWGKGSADRLDLRSEYDVTAPPETPPATPPPVTPPPDAPKFTHKLANGTVLEGASYEELSLKIEKAVMTPTPAPLEFEDKPLYTPYEFKTKELTLQEQAEILNLWKENPQAAMRKLQEADLGAPAAKIIEVLQGTQQVLRQRMEEEAAAEFLFEAETYNVTPANGKKLTAYLKEKGKPITKQNLMVAFNQLVAAGDKNLVRAAETPVVEDDKDTVEVPPPPVIVPSNQGRPETPPAGNIDAGKFASLGLDGMKKYFAEVKRRQA